MKSRPDVSIGGLLVAALAFASIPGCTAPGARGRTTPNVPETIRWTLPVKGLLLGIEVPRFPFFFEPVRDWTGPLTIEEKDPSGKGTIVRVNPGGSWHKTAVLRVFVKNTSDNAILWSREHAAWHISFPAPASAQPQELPGPTPAPLWTGPIRLEPGETSTLEFPMSEVGDLWPLVPPGQYAVTVSYLPTDLTYRAQGGKGNYTYPYDVPGFWTGVIETPAIVINVQHSATPST
jgi:hypothetical protein